MNQNSNPSREAAEGAVASLMAIFAGIVRVPGRSLLEAEEMCLRAGHAAMCEAMSQAIELYDAEVCSSLQAWSPSDGSGRPPSTLRRPKDGTT